MDFGGFTDYIGFIGFAELKPPLTIKELDYLYRPFYLNYKILLSYIGNLIKTIKTLFFTH